MESFSYSNPVRSSYGFGLLNFDTAQITNSLVPPPRCKNGRVADIHVRATVTFSGVTTAPNVLIGTAATAAKYAQLNVATLAAGSAANFATAGGTPYNEALVIFSDINFDRDGVTAVQVQTNPGTGGGHAGTGFLDVHMAWF